MTPNVCVLKVLVIAVLVRNAELISSTAPSQTSLEMLWNLTNLALQHSNVQGRQYGQRPEPFYGPQSSYYPPQSPHYQGTHQRPQQIPSHYLGHPGSYPGQYSPQQDPNYQNQASIMDVLYSVAHNDELHCVPKLLCELTSNTRSRSEQSVLPFNVNMESLLGLFSAFGPTSNPLFLFGRAALLGYTSHGSSCYSAFSQCPNDPDKLVHYLNNYNGGFFRYFNGNPRPNPNYPNHGYPNQGYPNQGYPNPKFGAHHNRPIYPRPELPGTYPHPHGYTPGVGLYQQYPQKRIQTNKYPYAPQYDNYNYDYYSGHRLRSKINGVKFPSDDGRAFNEVSREEEYKSGKTLTFPGATSVRDDRFSQRVRAGKTLSFPDAHYQRGLDFQMVHPNHVASPYIFPTRTGTGELLLDTEELY